jgi:hypothetical protein
MTEQTNEIEPPVVEGEDMAKIGVVVDKPLTEQDNPEAVHLGPARTGDATVDVAAYPERPYDEAKAE